MHIIWQRSIFLCNIAMRILHIQFPVNKFFAFFCEWYVNFYFLLKLNQVKKTRFLDNCVFCKYSYLFLFIKQPILFELNDTILY